MDEPMPIAVDREAVGRLVADGAQLAEVLPRVEFDEEHLPGAVHVPLKHLPTAASVLDRTRPVIVYCWDGLCDMSPRAAWQLERLGFDTVYDYVLGKVDWMAAGLPTVRADITERRALDAADRDPPMCGPDTPVALAAQRVAGAGRASLVVINDSRIVLGRAGLRDLRGPRDTAVEAVMQPGPATVRAHEPLDPLIDRMASRRANEMIVSTPEGRLLGVVYGDLEASR